MQSIFLDKNLKPTATALEKGLANTFGLWQDLEDFTTTAYPNAVFSFFRVQKERNQYSRTYTKTCSAHR